jgi:hypothetical protein
LPTFDRPVNAVVADVMGATNLFRGRVVARIPLMERAASAPFAEGDRVRAIWDALAVHVMSPRGDAQP